LPAVAKQGKRKDRETGRDPYIKRAKRVIVVPAGKDLFSQALLHFLRARIGGKSGR
jgi:hypothetical protein